MEGGSHLNMGPLDTPLTSPSSWPHRLMCHSKLIILSRGLIIILHLPMTICPWVTYLKSGYVPICSNVCWSSLIPYGSTGMTFLGYLCPLCFGENALNGLITLFGTYMLQLTNSGWYCIVGYCPIWVLWKGWPIFGHLGALCLRWEGIIV